MGKGKTTGHTSHSKHIGQKDQQAARLLFAVEL